MIKGIFRKEYNKNNKNISIVIIEGGYKYYELKQTTFKRKPNMLINKNIITNLTI